jgi:hypothetical protein
VQWRFPTHCGRLSLSYNSSMEMLDILALTGLDRLYDRVEGRYGRTAAWLVTSATALALIGIIVWVLFAVLWR